MGKTFDQIDERLGRWIAHQKVFFVASAPSANDGLINCSPKGLDSLRILDGKTLAYLDLTGSGAETIAHLRENGRIVILFCALDGPPKIIRVHGRGEVIGKTHADFQPLLKEFPHYRSTRSIIRVHATRISDSCGYGVPLYQCVGDRDSLKNWADKKSDDEIENYRQENNRVSIDGLPALGDNE